MLRVLMSPLVVHRQIHAVYRLDGGTRSCRQLAFELLRPSLSEEAVAKQHMQLFERVLSCMFVVL